MGWTRRRKCRTQKIYKQHCTLDTSGVDTRTVFPSFSSPPEHIFLCWSRVVLIESRSDQESFWSRVFWSIVMLNKSQIDLNNNRKKSLRIPRHKTQQKIRRLPFGRKRHLPFLYNTNVFRCIWFMIPFRFQRIRIFTRVSDEAEMSSDTTVLQRLWLLEVFLFGQSEWTSEQTASSIATSNSLMYSLVSSPNKVSKSEIASRKTVANSAQ